jgi:hypothetical protein
MKTLLEHYYNVKIEALSNDLDNGYAKKLVTIEMMANEVGWKYLCDKTYISKHYVNIYEA